jgi:hypothetical protein
LADSGELVAQQIRPVEREPYSAVPEEWIFLAGHGQIGQRLVASDVQGAQRDAAAA